MIDLVLLWLVCFVGCVFVVVVLVVLFVVYVLFGYDDVCCNWCSFDWVLFVCDGMLL